jgi:hypothetical protein
MCQISPLTNSMEQSPCWEANNSMLLDNKFPAFMEPEGHYHVHKSLPAVPILNQTANTSIYSFIIKEGQSDLLSLALEFQMHHISYWL